MEKQFIITTHPFDIIWIPFSSLPIRSNLG